MAQVRPRSPLPIAAPTRAARLPSSSLIEPAPFRRGIRRLEGALPPATLREKLPRFLQKCAQEFQDEPRYRDDPRYLRVWIQMVSLLPATADPPYWMRRLFAP
jgi:hypothetical protein